MSVGFMLKSMTSAELSEWEAYFRVEPFGYERNDLMIAQLTAITANIARKRGTPAFKITDFMPYHKKDQRSEGLSVQIKETLLAHNRNREKKEKDD